MRRWVWIRSAIGCAAALACLARPARAADPGTAFFEQKVRPLLVERCYKCHSANAKKVKGGLLLDSKAGWTKGGENGPAIIPGKPEQSLLIKAIGHADPDLQMPPEKAGGKLSPADIQVLTEWVKLGAPDPRLGAPAAVATTKPTIDFDEARRFWSFQPLRQSAPPAVRDAAWCQTPVDRFVLAKLEAKHVVPNPAADRRQLIRRACLDLTGLPPTPQEIEVFINDPDPSAYGKLIDRLLESPHYGERWARHWLDLARFAESHGFEHDYDRPSAYHYRDFVIRALNQDLPYNTFVQWQLAGDEIAPENPQATMATGFLAAGVHSTQITKNEVEKQRYDELDDMLATTGTAMLGLTVGCARCHDHKFDPIPSRDYYRLLSAFTTCVRSEVELILNASEDQKAKEAFDREHAPLAAALDKFEREELRGRFDRWLQNGPSEQRDARAPHWTILDMQSLKSEGNATLTKQPDGSVLASGINPDFDTYIFTARTDLTNITSVRIEALPDPSMVKGGPGRASNGNFALSDFRLMAAPLSGGAPVIAKLAAARATFEQPGLLAAFAIDGDKHSAWAIDPQFGKEQAVAFDLAAPLGYAGGTLLTFTLEFKNNNGHNIGRPRFSITTAPPSPSLSPSAPASPQGIDEILAQLAAAGPAHVLSPAQRSSLLGYYRSLDPDWQKLNRVAMDHAARAPKPHLTKVLAATEGLPAVRLHTQGEDFFPQTYVLRRGDPNQKLEVATPAYLQVLMTAPDGEKHWQAQPPSGWRTSFRRRGLASWMTDADHGAGQLLARVIVNRLWQHHLGRGIVGTPSDFGTRGDPPTHPELLDYLATELIRNGWHLKPIHKLIMTSSVYEESSVSDAERAAIDRDNSLLWYHPRHRLEAEVVRDSILSVSGLLDPTMFGPGTLDENSRRRSIYFTVKRSHLIPMMTVFDAPDALGGVGDRPTTTIAPQALLLMNNANVRACAKALAKCVAPTAATPPDRAIQDAYRTALGRAPAPEELADAVTFLTRETQSHQAGGRADAGELAMADLCQILLCLNEFVYTD